MDAEIVMQEYPKKINVKSINMPKAREGIVGPADGQTCILESDMLRSIEITFFSRN